MSTFEKQFIWDGWGRRLKWMFDDYGITIDNDYSEEEIEKMENGELVHFFCPYGNIEKINLYQYSDSIIEITFYSKDYEKSHFAKIILPKREYSKRDIKKTVEFAEKQRRLNKRAFDKFIIYKEVSGNKFDDGEYIMQCEICGQVFKYTKADIDHNFAVAREAMELQEKTLTKALFVSPVVASLDLRVAENNLKTKRNISSCPHCNSRELKRISKEELKEIQEKQNTFATSPSTSNFDDIIKLKELLDQGIITTEEFNAKKKQLLGL